MIAAPATRMRTLQESRAGGSSAWRLLCAVSVAVILACLVSPARGQMRVVGGGVVMDVATQWPDGAGYRPMRITLTPSGTGIANRTFSVEFTTHEQWRGARNDLRIVQDIELPAGSAAVTTTLAVPYVTGHTSYAFRVAEGGRWVRGLGGTGSFQGNAEFEAMPRVLAIADQGLDSSNLGRAFLNTSQYNPGGRYMLQTFQTIRRQDLPARWIDYSALDMICISLDDLEALKAGQADAFDAILDWTAAGGNLLVYDLGAEWERRAALEQLLGFSAEDGTRTPAWQTPRKGQFGERVGGIGPDVYAPFAEITEPQNYGYGGYMQSPVAVEELSDTEKQQKKIRPRAAPDRPPFAMCPFEMGMLVAVATDKPFDEDAAFWAWLCNQLTSRRVIWCQRHGFSRHQDNIEFFKFLVPGVGRAPLNAFRVLITLFVVAIGPINYFILRRFRRLHLLVVTVPVSAAAVTLALFAYALISDGLGTRVRVRSVTRINQTTGRTECWARLSYYSGLAPGDGLQFSQDVAVHSIRSMVGDPSTGSRELIWHKGQKLAKGWLRSRTPAQFLTVRSRRTDLGIAVGRPSDVGLPIENRLGATVEKLVLRGEDGKFYWAEEIAAGGKLTAEEIDAAGALADVVAAFDACEMNYPPGMNGSNTPYRYRRRWYGGASQAPSPTPQTSLLEGAIQQARQAAVSPLSEFGPRSYLAVVEVSPEVELGNPRARPEASLHVIVGTW